MVEVLKDENTVLLKTPSSQNGVGSVITAFSDYLKQQGISDHSINRAIIVLRELLVNAIQHGNKHNAAYPVTIGVRKLEQNKVKILVKDYGRGFDYRSLDTRLPENPRKIHTRGYRLIKAFCDSFEFNREGNEVTAYVSISLASKSKY